MTALEQMLACPDCRFLPEPLTDSLADLLDRPGGAVAVDLFIEGYHAADHDLTVMQRHRADRSTPPASPQAADPTGDTR